ncbi:MAG: SigE family RNA polymerase sigma factor [Acidimicrobiales bacterium]|nr:SigE family RNA polymerase sigma factor [Acidimicrobiales bacterium]
MTKSSDDGATVTRLHAVRTSGFDDLYRTEVAGLVRTATLIVGSRPVAEDLVQDAFVRVHAKWDRIDNPPAYARRAVVNACRSHLRRRAVERRHLGTLSVEVAELEARELLDALAQLPSKQRAAIVLRFYSGLSERETADALDCPTGTVGSLVHRGLATLRTRIER